MKSEKTNIAGNEKKCDNENDKEIYTGEDDEEVLNCEGEPCNFVYKDEKQCKVEYDDKKTKDK